MAYGTTTELMRLLKIGSPSAAQLAAGQTALDAAASEIDWELGYTTDIPAPVPTPPLVVTVQYQRAVELWNQNQSPHGVIGIGAETEPIVTARNTWHRHALKLQPLKVHYGVA